MQSSVSEVWWASHSWDLSSQNSQRRSTSIQRLVSTSTFNESNYIVQLIYESLLQWHLVFIHWVLRGGEEPFMHWFLLDRPHSLGDEVIVHTSLFDQQFTFLKIEHWETFEKPRDWVYIYSFYYYKLLTYFWHVSWSVKFNYWLVSFHSFHL